MVNRLKKYIYDNGLFLPEDRILLAVSGGVDSMVMADLFIKCGYRVGIAHCNFSLRERESDKDELLVKQLANSNSLPFHSIKFSTKEYAKKQSVSIQMAARDLRYGWFRKICEEHSYQYIATAHNLDDKIETFFLNLTRGTGIKGLSGMPAKNGDIIHPILFASRKDIEKYAMTSAIAFREDASNATIYYVRNRIRHNVIPELRVVNPSFGVTMDENMRRIAQAGELVGQMMDKLRECACRQDGEVYVVNIDALRSFQPLSLFLFELLHPFGFTADTIVDVEKTLAEQSGKRFFSPTHQLVKNRKELLITSTSYTESGEYKIEEDDTEITFPIAIKVERIALSSVKSLDEGCNVAYIDADKIMFPLWLRMWQIGDTFIPFGMKGRKKLSDFFIDSKLSLLEKQQQWILLSNDSIVWVVGRRIDNGYRVDRTTKSVLRIEYKR